MILRPWKRIKELENEIEPWMVSCQLAEDRAERLKAGNERLVAALKAARWRIRELEKVQDRVKELKVEIEWLRGFIGATADALQEEAE